MTAIGRRKDFSRKLLTRFAKRDYKRERWLKTVVESHGLTNETEKLTFNLLSGARKGSPPVSIFRPRVFQPLSDSLCSLSAGVLASREGSVRLWQRRIRVTVDRRQHSGNGLRLNRLCSPERTVIQRGRSSEYPGTRGRLNQARGCERLERESRLGDPQANSLIDTAGRVLICSVGPKRSDRPTGFSSGRARATRVALPFSRSLPLSFSSKIQRMVPVQAQ